MNESADTLGDRAAPPANDAMDFTANAGPSNAAIVDPANDERRFRFIADRPAALASDDVFGHLDYSKAIATSLMDAPPPFTLGLFGAWGVGKTSIITLSGMQFVPRAARSFPSTYGGTKGTRSADSS